ncbi:MAG TPA: hypothetical protein DCX06_04530 [Opitutae bacterium]|nr:hypothetical protein [Opitutae bacterium]
MKLKVLFIASKQPNYSRIKLLKAALEEDYEVNCVFSGHASYPMRLIDVCWRFMWMDKKAYDVIVVGFFAQLFFPFIRLFWRGRLISDCFISLYDSLICDRSKYKEGGLIARFARFMDAYMLRHSDLTLTDTQSHANYLVDEFSIDPTKVVPVAVSADVNVFPFTPAKAEDYSPDAVFNVLFYGAYIPLQGTEVIVRAAKLLEGQAVTINMVGDGQTYASTRSLAEELSVENVQFYGLQTLERLAEMSCESHLLLGIFGTTEKARRVIPNKVFEAVALGRPVITGDSCVVRAHFADGDTILLVPFADPQALAKKILWAKQHYQEAAAIGKAGHSVFANELSPAHVSAKLNTAIRAVVSS